jgi:hypothetical protein
MPPHGIVLHRGLREEHIPRSTFTDPGVFGRLFPTLRARPKELTPDLERSLQALAARMQQQSDAAQGGEENPRIPAGFTFLGQFIDHDITFDPTSSLEQQNDPEAIRNFRTPLLELDSLYGSGRGASAYLYDQAPSQREAPVRFLIGVDSDGGPNDLPRNRQGTAIIGDPRNDENLMISQLHLTFLKFHNRVVDHIRAHGVEHGFDVPDDPDNVFYEAQRVVRWHYQWIVAHEFLPLIVGDELVADILYGKYGRPGKRGQDQGKGKPKESERGGARTVAQDPIGNVLDTDFKLFRWKVEPFIPIEFAVGAYRFGHSQVRRVYFIKDGVQARFFPAVPGDPDFDADDPGSTLFTPLNLTADQPRVLRADRQADLAVLFDLNGPGTARRSLKIDTTLSPSLFRLPTGPGQFMSLALRNLRRGYAFALPWGQRVAEAIGVRPLSERVLGLESLGFPRGRAPLWYYVLKEAEVLHRGEYLGPVGGRIVAEVLLGLLIGDPKSYLADQPNWEPFLPPNDGDFTMADLVRFATA